MDEMTLLREFRASAPAAAPSEVRERALGERRASRRRPVLRLAVAAALAVTGGGVAVTVLQPASPSAAAVLDRAALALADSPTPPPPTPLQWVYQRTLFRDPHTGQAGTHAGESWSRFDGALGADRRPDGKAHVQGIEYSPLGTPQQWYDVLVALPERPEDVLAFLRRDPLYTSDAATQADRDFDEVTQALTADTFVPPADQARLYLALAAIPGVGVDEKAAPDLVGRPVLSITFTGDTSLGRAGDRWELLLDPATYAVLGLRGTAGSDIDLGEGTIVTAGHVWYEMAILDHRIVDRAGATG
jgi:hypothetical protein